VATSAIAEDEDTGYLVVEVPASPDAPHMVDGAYWARSDTTKYRCSDADVRRILQSRADGRHDAAGLLEAEVARDPTPDDLRENAHLFIVARPLLPVDLHAALAQAGTTLRAWIQHQLHHDGFGPQARNWWDPDLRGTASNATLRARGAALHSYCMGPDRGLQPNGPAGIDEASLLDLEIDEDGTIHLFCGRGSDRSSQSGNKVLFTGLVGGLLLRVVAAAAAISEAASYQGPWTIGLALTNLRGTLSWEVQQDFGRSGHTAYSEDEYRMVIEATTADLTHHEDEILGKLTGRLCRALATPAPTFRSIFD
jgi:hypothetical protein